ncbi:MAG: IS110 family transposase [Caldilineaceae bacterium]|jgi:transposase
MMTIYLGIDWSEKKHDVTFMHETGETILTHKIEHNVAGFECLEEKRRQLQVEPAECVIGIESAHTLLIDYLWAAGHEQIYVVPPSTIASNRGRHRQSGARNDQYDSWVIAETLRTDLSKLQPWAPGSDLLQQMRVYVSYGEMLTQECTRLGNRLRNALLRYYPVALNVFPSWPTQIVCAFVHTYPTPEAAAELTYDEFADFCRRHRYPKQRLLPARYAALQAVQPAPRPALVAAYAEQVRQLAQALQAALHNKQANLKRLDHLFRQHPDAPIFAALPGTGQWLAPALLVKFGEDRQRFPTVGALQALAGTCPVTYQSGKKQSVRFRRSCDHSFRQITQQWARCAISESDWAASYHHQVLARSRSRSHADRCLANRLLAIAWKLWQTSSLYDERIHLQNCVRRTRPLG